MGDAHIPEGLLGIKGIKMRLFNIEKSLFLTMFGFAFIGPLYSINLGFFSLYPFRVILLGLIFFSIINVFMRGHVVLKHLSYIRYQLAFFSLWFIFAFMSFFWALSLSDYVRQLSLLFIGIGTIFIAVNYLKTPRDMLWPFLLWIAALTALILVGIWESITGNHLAISTLYGELRPRFAYAPTGTFHNQNDYSTYLALSIPFAVSVSRYSKKWHLKTLGVVLTISALVLIVVAGSRANLLAVLVEMMVLVSLMLGTDKRIKFSLITLLVIVSLAFIPYIQGAAIQAVTSIISISEQASSDHINSIIARDNLIKNGLTFFTDTAGLGVGAGNAEYWMANFSLYPTKGLQNLHNWWVELMVNYGLIILSGYLVMYLSIIRGLWRLRHRLTNDQRMICDALFLSLVGFSLASISPSSIMGFLPQWILFAFALAYLNVNLNHVLFYLEHDYEIKDDNIRWSNAC